MNHSDQSVVDVRNAQASSSIVILCEHASAHIPSEFKDLGLPASALQSHVVWDPGALAVAERLADALDAILVASKVSRLVYDCNRPPDAPDAMPARSEIVDVPGNATLSPAQKAERVARYYNPFRAAVADVMASKPAPVLVTIHSFTPIYHGSPRDVEIGILHDTDTRLAEAMLDLAPSHTGHVVRRNEPYAPRDGVTHSLKEHALPGGHLNVMIELRNDLLGDDTAQSGMADVLTPWIKQAVTQAEALSCNS